MTKSLVAASVLAATVASGSAMAEVSMNIGATSNYMWRGVTQSDDGAAVSGGVDYAHEAGFYAGTWTSSLAGGEYELDLYAGYGGEAGDFGYDVGVISYQYPVSETYFHEAYFNGNFNILSFGAAYTLGSDDDDSPAFSQDDIYVYAGLESEVAAGITMGATIGSYSFENDSDLDYNHFALSVSKSDFTIALEKNDMDDSGAGEDNPRVTVSWGTSF
ncbi:MAG: TorF family putative porin [Gammaproteobacteria bacterium]|nr:TorF family putative porin [Gammaproteobacteria bacterium]MCW8958357.1 TorF family putative porin [Gammaproteobacteria bacterium]MCW9088577.1 TorF family putative porin [Gammaproteobacteria bacterium]